MTDLRNCAQKVFPEGSVWITDIPGAVLEKSGLHAGDATPRNVWQHFDYETMGGIRGRLLYAPEVSGAGELSIPLPVNGWHRICLGLVSTLPGMLGIAMGLRVRLNSDPAFYTVSGTGINFYWELTDNLWKSTNLENSTLHIARAPTQSSLAWIRLEPMNAKEIEAAERRIAKQNKHNLVASNDSYSISTLEDFYGAILPFRESNVSKLYFGLAQGDVCDLLPTRVGTLKQLEDTDYPRPIDRDIAVSLDMLRQAHPDAVAKICDFSHRMGLEFHASCRTGAMHMSGFGRTSEFFRKHPEFRCVDRDGTPVTRLSFAAPEVRTHFLELFREMLEYEVDGLNLIFIRALPSMLYEPPFQKDFAAAYGVNPLDLPENDPRISVRRAAIMSGFILQVRAMLDECGARRNKHLELSLTVPATREVNDFHGMALKQWADEGLIDLIMPDSAVLTRFHDEQPDNIEYEYFADICAGNNCRFYPKMFFWNSPGAKIPDAYREVIQKGAAGGMMWDAVSHYVSQLSYWEYVQMLGDDDETVLDDQIRRRSLEARLHLLKTLEGFDCDHYSPHNGF